MFEINRVKLASYLVRLRSERCLSQVQFAELLGIHQQDVSRFETGRFSKKGPTTQSLVLKVIEVFQISERDLLEQIGGPEAEVTTSVMRIVLPLFQMLIPDSVISTMTPEDVEFLLTIQDDLRKRGISMTSELATALLSSRQRPTVE